jgi:hypothetical protein
MVIIILLLPPLQAMSSWLSHRRIAKMKRRHHIAKSIERETNATKTKAHEQKTPTQLRGY